MKTFIKWQGNKSRHVNKIIKYIPEDINTYIEPFVGSGALLLALEPDKWIINDLNKDLVLIWKYIKEDPETIIKMFKTFGKTFKPLSKQDKIDKCTNIIKKFDHMKYDIKRASLYMLMKYCSFMGNIMKNKKYFFNGLEMNIYVDSYPFLKEANYNNLLNVSDYLNDTNGKIYNKDYTVILDKAKKGDFVFLDPPYLEQHNYNFNYNKDEIINEVFIKNLLKELKKLDKKGVKWMMTQANTTQIRKIFKDYTIKTFKAYRASKKTHVNELIIMNYSI